MNNYSLTFLGRAHALSVRGDRILRIVGHVKGKWYTDSVLDYVNSNQFRMCHITEDTPEQITVIMQKEVI